jgi:hypothetical protein
MCHLLANGLRLFERVGRPAFTAEYLRKTMLEDSFHNLMFGFIMVSASPQTMMGIFSPLIFATFAALTFIINGLDAWLPNSGWAQSLKTRCQGLNAHANKGYEIAAKSEVGVAIMMVIGLVFRMQLKNAMDLIM